MELTRYRLRSTIATAPSVGGEQRPLICDVKPESIPEPGEVTVTATIDGTAPTGETWTVPLGLFVNGAQVDSANVLMDDADTEVAEWTVDLEQNGSYNIQVTAGDPY